jgi:hypothetical protein
MNLSVKLHLSLSLSLCIHVRQIGRDDHRTCVGALVLLYLHACVRCTLVSRTWFCTYLAVFSCWTHVTVCWRVADTAGSFACRCAAGWSGNGTNCSNVDECATHRHNCSALANCTDTEGSYTCACDHHTGYGVLAVDGATCLDTNECRERRHNCSQLAFCNNTEGSYFCTCMRGYNGTGLFCQDVDECSIPELMDCDMNAVSTLPVIFCLHLA